LEPEPEPEPEPVFEAAFEPEPEPEPELESAFEPESIAEPMVAAALAPIIRDDTIVSEPALQAGAAAFGELARTVRPERTPGGGVTVEELATELMRPMLREWLDENLPGMVERLVRREIERMARNGDDE
jgi:cell pole-organizing protein PopZ